MQIAAGNAALGKLHQTGIKQVFVQRATVNVDFVQDSSCFYHITSIAIRLQIIIIQKTYQSQKWSFTP